MLKQTLVIGASENPERYSNKAIIKLQEHNIPTYGIGLREGKIKDVTIDTDLMPYSEIHTVSLYVSAKNQEPYINYIIGLKPQRVIFNPGTENPEFYKVLKENNINFEEACTLVLLSIDAF